MKKITLLLLSAATLVALSFTSTTADFEGKITYEINVEGGNLPPEAMVMFEGSGLTVYVKGSKSRSEIIMGMQNTTTISDNKSNTSVTLMEMMGNKYKIKSEPKKDEKVTEPTVKYLDETKVIAGYKCKKAEITFKDQAGESQVSNVYYTEEISNYMGSDKRSSHFKGIKGLMLEFEMNAERGMKMKMSAKSVSKESVPDSKFDIPSEYKESTMEDIQKEMMKMMGGQH